MGTVSAPDTPRPLAVNDHVPLQLEKEELPVMQVGNAVTLDGALS